MKREELTRASPPALSLERELKKIEGEDVERLTINVER
jgi:hypothetical protein